VFYIHLNLQLLPLPYTIGQNHSNVNDTVDFKPLYMCLPTISHLAKQGLSRGGVFTKFGADRVSVRK
jgi:hypothetical protein